MRLIDADALEEDIREYLFDDDELEHSKMRDSDRGYNNGLKCAIRRIKLHAPTINVAHTPCGHWERMDEYCNHSREFKCSVCKQSVCYEHFARSCDYTFCPNCGAKMDD